MTYSDQKAYFFQIDNTIKSIRTFMQKSLNEAKINLTVDQWLVLDQIANNDGISQSLLGQITSKDAPTITRILDILAKKSIILRKMGESDRRKFEIFTSKIGNQLHADAFKVISNCRKTAWNGLNDVDFTQLVRIMETINTNVA